MKYLLLFVLIVFSSCAKEMSSPATDDSDRNLKKMNAFMNGVINIDYKNDYRINKLNEEVPPQVLPLPKERELIQYASSDLKVMMRKYPEVKSTISEWVGINENDRYTWAIQNASLKYLRKLFLNENEPTFDSEILFLMDVLIETKSVDLDVLADAFHNCSLNLSTSDRNRYFNYIEKLFFDEVSTIRINGPKFKEKYENSTGPTKMKYLAYGKDLERRSKACQHTSDLLGIEVPPVD